jgi:hypothetical protein
MIPEDFDESDQAAFFSKIRLPDDWYDNRPPEEKFKNFGYLIPVGEKSEPIKILYKPNRMTASEKAKYLVDKYEEIEYSDDWGDPQPIGTEAAKQCAIICVNEILEQAELLDEMDDHVAHLKRLTISGLKANTTYWKSVLQEINKLP